MVLKLESISIFNFKSFKGVHTIKGLNDHFTAIVGPNGSGKSNIIDSILFVLGFKAKKMRHAVLRDLINVGCTEGYVELIFNEFTLKRSLIGKIGPDNTLKNVISKYELNNKEQLANEIIEYLKQKGIDLDNNRFLILQGEIETISMMNPLELLEYIEDCIGSSALKPKIEELEVTVKSKQEEANILINNLKFIESDYLFKKGRRDKKFKFLIFRNESLILKDKIVHMKNLIAQRKEKTFSSEKKIMEENLVKILEKNKNFNAEIKKLENFIEDLEPKEKELIRHRNEYNRIERSNKQKIIKIDRLEKSIESNQTKLDDNKQALIDWDNESKTLHKSLKDNSDEIVKLEANATRNKKELSKFDEINQQQKIKAELEKKLLRLINIKETKNKDKDEIKVLEERSEILSQKLQGNGTIENVESKSRALETDINQINKDMKATAQEIARRKYRIEENSRLEQNYKKEKEVLHNLQEIPGVFGLLKDLGSYEKKYEEAVEASTKCLKNVVVDSSTTAEKCISIITKKNLNRTTFIILDKMPDYVNVDIPINSKAEILYKKIKCENKFKKLFYFAFKDTLCVETLDEAKSLAFGNTRRRVVTLDGKLMEKSGVMSGGKGSKKIKSAVELEDIYRNMEILLMKKTKELSELKEYENNKKMVKSFISELACLKREIETKSKKLNTEDYNTIDNNIIQLRKELQSIEQGQLPEKAVEISKEIQLINEKLDYFQRLNQEVKMRLGSEPIDNKRSYINEIQKYKRELELIVLEEIPNSDVLNHLEKEYNLIFEKNKQIEEQIKNIRTEMGNSYYEEAQIKTNIENAINSLKECDKIMKNCKIRASEIKNEFTMTRNLLTQIDPTKGIVLDSEDVNYEDMSDQELKDKSKQLIEELNCKESDNFTKLKELEKNNNDDIEEDLEIYRIVFSEFNESKKVYDEMKNTTDFLTAQLTSTKQELEALRNSRLVMFLEGFNAINKNIKEIFNLITFGGNAELDLLDYLNPFSEGIILNIMPPKKSWKQISNLSGGEKTLSSLGLIFALHKFNPSCLYIMDEIDAALDYKNVSVISQYLTHVKSQFIIISLRNDMFEMARTLIGVYKFENVSKTVTVDLDRLASAL